MERIFTLIDKLSQQKAQGAPAANLLFTVQLLQQELLQLQKKEGTAGTRKVAVTLPFQSHTQVTAEPVVVPIVEPQAPAYMAPAQVAEVPAPVVEAPAPVVEEKEIYFLDITEEESQEEVAPVQVSPVEEPKEYSLRKPPVQEILFGIPKPAEEQRPSYVAQQLFNSAFDTTVEVPTLAPYKSTEVHERIAEKKESLNDRLKQEKAELGHMLKEAPIKDLRKGIGINDRFVFVKELFRGDDAAYERSIKTINNFGIYSEAEFWMSRELKLKLGWNEDNPTVQHFYQLVRRRFS
ncbi:hypothetical protein HRG84_14240 [Flavisolibacter sp. BT320]|nr:hypothetical protein [Flavisolibacter longurius]